MTESLEVINGVEGVVIDFVIRNVDYPFDPSELPHN